MVYQSVGALREGNGCLGDRFGLIRFGSRVDVFVPADSKIRVNVGDAAYAGVTVLSELTNQ